MIIMEELEWNNFYVCYSFEGSDSFNNCQDSRLLCEYSWSTNTEKTSWVWKVSPYDPRDNSFLIQIIL